MKKLSKCLVLMLAVLFILPLSIILTGCSKNSMVINFYDTKYNVVSSTEYKYGNYGLNIREVAMPNAPSITGYNHIGWYEMGYKFKLFENIGHEIIDFQANVYYGSSTGELNFLAAYEISNEGWNYSGTNQNAFKWISGTYASPALNLSEGVNYIRFDKETTASSLKYCKVFENGSASLGHISGIEILNNNAFAITDINLDKNVWENQTLEADQSASFVIKITTTKAIQAGIMIGSDASILE